MSINRRILSNREVCGECNKGIFCGQNYVICNKCDLIQHGKCSSKIFQTFRQNWYCISCLTKYTILRYNPFYDLINNADSSDHFYDSEPEEFVQSLENISNILENSKSFSHSELINEINDKKLLESSILSTYFLNIDGNNTNFEYFVVEINHYKNCNFSIIGLAETNTNPDEKALFDIEGYESVYQQKLDGKSKGSGVALYINEKYNFTVNEKLSFVNENIECLFINLTNLEETVYVGVVYRPPNGNLSEFNAEIKNILSELPSKNVYIMGDYNIDLLKINTKD